MDVIKCIQQCIWVIGCVEYRYDAWLATTHGDVVGDTHKSIPKCPCCLPSVGSRSNIRVDIANKHLRRYNLMAIICESR